MACCDICVILCSTYVHNAISDAHNLWFHHIFNEYTDLILEITLTRTSVNEGKTDVIDCQTLKILRFQDIKPYGYHVRVTAFIFRREVLNCWNSAVSKLNYILLLLDLKIYLYSTSGSDWLDSWTNKWVKSEY